ncbi:MAG TPA: hypothetical protein DD381_06445 [Lentisphaeria bacterium]|nr:MAG: hypothetical protein A2X47_13335 [Lentisphaerae bacterium GWF2_38_69]HBM15965.1 hypothetical protein [Lentisphaeria bacterium]
MSTFPLKEKYNLIIKPWFFALGVCLLAHLLFFILFSPIDTVKKEISSSRSGIVMLPLDNKNIPSSLKEIISWMKDENPTLIVLPNLNFGYSELLLSKETFRLQQPVFSILDYRKFIPATDNTQQETTIRNIPVNSLTFSDYMPKLTWFDTARPPAIAKAPLLSQKVSYPYVTDFYTGMPIDIKFFDLVDKKDKIIKFNPHGPTVIELYIPQNPSLILSGRIIESSNSSELDEIALRNLSVCKWPDEIYDKFKNNLIFARVEWLPVYSNNNNKEQEK